MAGLLNNVKKTFIPIKRPYGYWNIYFCTMDNLTKEQRRKVMQANKSTGTKMEILLAKTLFARGHHYRKNDKSVFGKPDLTFKKIKLAIFVDGEFWHGKDWEDRKSECKTNAEYWNKKIERNIGTEILGRKK